MPKAKKQNKTYEYKRISAESAAHCETNDCVVQALSLITGYSYERVWSACAAAGRRPLSGMTLRQITKAISLLGCTARAVDPRSFIDRYPKAHRILRSVTTHHPDRFHKVWADGATYLFLTRDHAAAVVDGTLHDWTRGSSVRVMAIYRIEKK